MSESKEHEPAGTLLWGGRFSSKQHPTMEKFNNSLRCDKEMWREDIKGSIEYSKALQKVGLLSADEQSNIAGGLQQIAIEWKEGTFDIKPSDEDIHTANERRLKEIIGPVGGKLHTGRSRNDQVAVDTRMWFKEHLLNLTENLKMLIKTLVERCDRESDVLMPGYTHLQRAQAIRWSHFLLSHSWNFCADLQRLKFLYWSADVCPLGSGAIAGNPFDVDREEIAHGLDFSRASQNSIQAVADRDFVAEYLFWCSLTACHLSRLAEDLIIYCTSEFGFVKLSDAFATGSSLMPQKKNPDSLELIRGKAGRFIGNVTGFLTVLKGLPTSYNKDLQQDKELLFESATTMQDMLDIVCGTVATLKINKDKCEKALTEDMLATDLAYYLVRKGMPFRQAHEKAGEVVQKAEELNCKLSEVPLDQLLTISSLFTKDVANIWSFENSVEQYSALGGTALSSVKAQILEIKKLLMTYSLQKIQM